MLCPTCDSGYYQCAGCGTRVCGCPHRCPGNGSVAVVAPLPPPQPVNRPRAGWPAARKTVARPPIDGMARGMLGY
jgi:hypothetical protein